MIKVILTPIALILDILVLIYILIISLILFEDFIFKYYSLTIEKSFQTGENINIFIFTTSLWKTYE